MQSRSASYIRRTQSKRLPMNVMATGGRARRLSRYDLNFAANLYRGVTAADIVCTRSTVAWGDDSAGNWTQFLANTLVRTDKGAQVWESRTNSNANNTGQGLTTGDLGSGGALPTTHVSDFASPLNGLTLTVLGSGTESGLIYHDIRLHGTTSGAGANKIVEQFSGNQDIAAVTNDRWFGSAFINLIAGSLTGITALFLSVDQRNSSGTILVRTTTSLLASTIPSVAALGTSRPNTGGTLTQATLAFVSSALYVSYSSGSALVDITFRVGVEQLEKCPSIGAGPTSPIMTTVAADTRAADVPSVPLHTTFPDGFTLTATGYPTQGNTYVPAQYIMSVDDGSTANYVGVGRRQTNDIVATFASAGPVPAILSVWTQSLAATISLADRSGYGVLSFTGQSPVLDTAAGFPSGLNTIHIGCKPDGTSQWNGYITDITLN